MSNFHFWRTQFQPPVEYFDDFDKQYFSSTFSVGEVHKVVLPRH